MVDSMRVVGWGSAKVLRAGKGRGRGWREGV